jgi:hypothetical protein
MRNNYRNCFAHNLRVPHEFFCYSFEKYIQTNSEAQLSLRAKRSNPGKNATICGLLRRKLLAITRKSMLITILDASKFVGIFQLAMANYILYNALNP